MGRRVVVIGRHRLLKRERLGCRHRRHNCHEVHEAGVLLVAVRLSIRIYATFNCRVLVRMTERGIVRPTDVGSDVGRQ